MTLPTACPRGLASSGRAAAIWAAKLGMNLQSSTLKNDETGEAFHVQQAGQIRAYSAAWKEAGHAREPRVSVSHSIVALNGGCQPMLVLSKPSAGGYAADLLTPRYLFAPRAAALDRIAVDSIAGLGQAFETSLTATAIRLLDLDQFSGFVISRTPPAGGNGSRARRAFPATGFRDNPDQVLELRMAKQVVGMAQLTGSHRALEEFLGPCFHIRVHRGESAFWDLRVR